MIFKVGEDAAWHEEAPGCFRHYSGLSMFKQGMLWHARNLHGNVTSRHRTSEDAFMSLTKKGFWTLDQFSRFTRHYGQSHHVAARIGIAEHVTFVFWAPRFDDFPGFVITGLNRRFVGIAKCAGCSAPLASLQTKASCRFDGLVDEGRSYLVCNCGCPVWQMEPKLYDRAYYVMEHSRGEWNRRQSMAKAGRKPSPSEIAFILLSQKGRCIYCHRLFTKELLPTKDHLLPLVAGGSDWVLNIVLACRSCNSARGDIPFRTYCTLLSPTQNRRIVINIARRLVAMEEGAVGTEAFVCFQEALAKHDPKHSRYCVSKGRNDRNVKTKRLLPRTPLAILRAFRNMQR
jgi:5-methylcytosine-specific restriction endonuclease McrA